VVIQRRPAPDTTVVATDTHSRWGACKRFRHTSPAANTTLNPCYCRKLLLRVAWLHIGR
jgi:hypothetical protein